MSALTAAAEVAREWFDAALSEDLERVGELTVPRTRHLMRSSLYGQSWAWGHYAAWDWASAKRLPSKPQLAAVVMTAPDTDDLEEMDGAPTIVFVLEDTAEGWQVVTFEVGPEDDDEDED